MSKRFKRYRVLFLFAKGLETHTGTCQSVKFKGSLFGNFGYRKVFDRGKAKLKECV